MIELAKHIEILLLDNDCVIVPGFGGFMAHHVDAVFDEEENQFLPPSRTLGFNPQLQINDSLLAQSYVEAYDISYPDALKRIEAEVCEMRQTINNEGYFELPDIGIIQLNDDGNMVFDPCISGILTPSLYALSSFEMKLLPDVKQYSETIKVEPVMKPVVEQSVAEETVVEEQTEDEPFIQSEYDEWGDETAKVISIKVSTLKKVAAVAVVLVVACCAAFTFGGGVKNGFIESAIDTSLFTKVMPQVQTTTPKELDTLKATAKKAIEEKKIEETKQTAEVQEKKEDGYVIVMASRVSKHNADNFVASLREQGISDARVLTKGNGNKVVCGGYDTESEARDSAQKLRNQSSDFKDVWVLHIKD